jgi:hypothetical protein
LPGQSGPDRLRIFLVGTCSGRGSDSTEARTALLGICAAGGLGAAAVMERHGA